jgi:hypothetical protein
MSKFTSLTTVMIARSKRQYQIFQEFFRSTQLPSIQIQIQPSQVQAGYNRTRRPEMEITRKKNPQASLLIFYGFLNPYPRVWIFFVEITKIWQKVSRLLVRGFFSQNF